MCKIIPEITRNESTLEKMLSLQRPTCVKTPFPSGKFGADFKRLCLCQGLRPWGQVTPAVSSTVGVSTSVSSSGQILCLLCLKTQERASCFCFPGHLGTCELPGLWYHPRESCPLPSRSNRGGGGPRKPSRYSLLVTWQRSSRESQTNFEEGQFLGQKECF